MGKIVVKKSTYNSALFTINLLWVWLGVPLHPLYTPQKKRNSLILREIHAFFLRKSSGGVVFPTIAISKKGGYILFIYLFIYLLRVHVLLCAYSTRAPIVCARL